jgi:hypothetical protein
MKPNQTDDELRRLFARGAGEEVSLVFTAQLIETLHRERLVKPNESFMAKWLGRVTIGVALASNALVLSRLHVFAAPPEMIYAVFAFVLGTFAATTLMKNLRAA